MTRTKKEYTKR